MHLSLVVCPLLLILLLCLCVAVEAKDPPYGQLAISGRKLISKKTKKTVKLHGCSLYWSQWLPRFWVAQTVNRLKCGCNANVVRAAMGTQRSFGGYVANQDAEYARMKTIIEAAINEGMYVVADWHTGDDLATDEISYAKDFFAKIAQNYGAKYTNILYEIWNEPNKFVTWDSVIKPYAKTIIDVIRKYDKNNVIIVGTPNWDQDVDIVAQSPLTGYSNIAYTVHFYAGYHTTWFRNKTQVAYDKVLPMFVTEYGIYSTTNDTKASLADLDKWYKMLDSMEISYTNWAVADVWDQKDMQSSMLYPTGVSIANICKPAYLSTFGNYIYKKLRSQDNGVKC